MVGIEESLTNQFYDWEKFGRGWHIWDDPVQIEPPFQPFLGHYLPDCEPHDDGRKPTFLSTLLRSFSQPKSPDTLTSDSVIEEYREPTVFERSDIVELYTSLPSSVSLSKEAFEHLLFGLSNLDEPVSFELTASREEITAQFAGCVNDVRRLRQQLGAFCSEGTFVERENSLGCQWTQFPGDCSLIVDFGLSREFMYPIAFARGFSVDPFIGISAALSELGASEMAVVQVLFERVRHPWAQSILRLVTDNADGDFFSNVPELLRQTREKVSRPLYGVVLRIAVKSDDSSRTLQIARTLTGAFSVFSTPDSNEFIPLNNLDYPDQDHETDLILRQSRRSGMILNSDELISLVHLPTSGVRSKKLRRDVKKSKSPPPNGLNSSGLVIGDNHHSGITSVVRLIPEQRARHTYVVGASGTGKSTFLFNSILQDIESGQGVAVIDPHGDLIDRIAGAIPEHRIEDVVFVDPSDEEFSIGFNILSAHSDLEKTLLASDLVSVFERLSTSWGDQMGSVLNNAIRAFLESRTGGTLADLRRFLIEPAFRNQFLETVDDPDVHYYWKKGFPTLSGGKSVGSIITRLDTFLSPKPIRYMVSQKANRLNFADILNSGKILLAKLSQGMIGKENSFLMGSLLVAKIHQAAMSRAMMPEGDRRHFWLYIDEFHNFITPSLSEILSGARKYRIGLILAHQELRQLNRNSDVASAVLSQPYSRICFRVGDEDARKLSDGFAHFDARDLQNLPNFEAICRIERADADFNISFNPAVESDESRAELCRSHVKSLSREKYACPRKTIESELGINSPKKSPTPPSDTPPSAQCSDSPVESRSPIQAHTHVHRDVQPIHSEPVVPASTPPIVTTDTFSGAFKTSQKQQDKGIGGYQHNLIRKRIELVAKQLGYTASREEMVGEGQKIDLVLGNSTRSIACEISITTTVDHEIGNVSKCIPSSFETIAVISPNPEHLRKIEVGVNASFSKENASRVKFFQPDEFISFLQDLTISTPPADSQSGERNHGKYKVRRVMASLDSHEAKDRESAAFGVVAENLKRKKKK